MKQQEIMPLIPIFDIGSNKLDYGKVKEHLITKQGQFTEFLKSYGFFCGDGKFQEKPDWDKYSLSIKFTKYFGGIKQGCKYELFIGQSGCFYRIKMEKFNPFLLHNALEFIGQFNKEIENICKQYVFTPYSVSHYADGDYFARKTDYEKEKRYCSSVEILNNTPELLEG